TRFSRDWSSDVCSSDLFPSAPRPGLQAHATRRGTTILQGKGRRRRGRRREGTSVAGGTGGGLPRGARREAAAGPADPDSEEGGRSEEHTSELQSREKIV